MPAWDDNSENKSSEVQEWAKQCRVVRHGWLIMYETMDPVKEPEEFHLSFGIVFHSPLPFLMFVVFFIAAHQEIYLCSVCWLLLQRSPVVADNDIHSCRVYFFANNSATKPLLLAAWIFVSHSTSYILGEAMHCALVPGRYLREGKVFFCFLSGKKLFLNILRPSVMHQNHQNFVFSTF